MIDMRDDRDIPDIHETLNANRWDVVQLGFLASLFSVMAGHGPAIHEKAAGAVRPLADGRPSPAMTDT
ncbi:MAG: hypothetical protein JO058_06420 [Alphaproteobacteria bacterium]|nr:hypothetical protein [Alphaproteobacteria bacterium]MBV9152335.1 hypothetical protein [Alphaproteobacteria bacterium]